MIPPGQVILAAIFTIGLPVGFLILGLLFLWRGIKGKRIGDTPYCRKCRYNLTGLASDVCPECGSDLSRPKARNVGIPRKRWGSLACSLILVTFSGVLVYRQSTQWNLIKHAPESVLAFFAKQESQSSQRELFLRLLITPEKIDCQNLIEYALDKQSERMGTLLENLEAPHDDFWLAWLVHCRIQNKMTTEQLKRYQSQFFRSILSIREDVRVGDPLPIAARYFVNHADTCNTSPSAYNKNSWEIILRVGIDGKEVRSPIRFKNRFSHPDLSDLLDTHFLEAGEHSLDITLEYAFPDTPEDGDPPRKTFSTSFVLLPADAPDPVVWITDEDFSSMFTFAMQPHRIVYDPFIVQDGGYLRMMVANPIPVDFPDRSFSVLFWMEFENGMVVEREYCFDENPDLSVVIEKYGLELAHAIIADQSVITLPIDIVPPEGTVDVRVKGCKEGARKTMNIYEAWKGEVLYEDVPLSHVKNVVN